MSWREVRYGVETMCIGGGQGLAALFERYNRLSVRAVATNGRRHSALVRVARDLRGSPQLASR